MCGIVGFLRKNNEKLLFNPINIIQQMTHEVKSRGPDFQDHWNDENSKVFLGHSRLSIIDLSAESNQPIKSINKRWTVVFNGEIYNYNELKKFINTREDISGDTKVLVSLIEKIGFRNAIEKLDGMYAIAAWDNLQHKLYLTRDRLGEKPLYYSINDSFVTFASNVNALRKFPLTNLNLSNEGIKNFFKLNYIPAPLSIYENIFKLNPANILVYDCKTKKYQKYFYWKLNKNKSFFNNKNLINKTENLLSETVKSQLISDVEVGTFLSGGVDSSLITILSKNFVKHKLKTFTLSSGDYNFDESDKAKKIANYIGSKNISYKFNKMDILNTIESIPFVYGEPFGDSSQLPTMLISRFAKNYVKVVLGGDGGDEMFGGYNRYKYIYNYLPKIKYLPNIARFSIAKLFTSTNPDNINKIFKILNYLLPEKKKFFNYGYLINKLGRIIDKNSLDIIFDTLISNSIDIDKLFNEKKFKKVDLNIKDIYDVIHHDTLNYLPDDILCKVDRASMAYGLEVRTPFVAKKVVEFSQQIRIEDKIKKGESKYLLKKILLKHLPVELVKGPKRGFSVPISEWLKLELREMLSDYSSKSFIQNQSIFNYEELNQIINNHFKKNIQNEKFLWSFLIFQNWYSKSR
ncbi:asparagine synthase (glutamine-hydrolyzing) [Candidatus Pelagibacter sp.]|nr:asparagine synthase (glutamine-hydrolyzing) [Candidatus Pelagibacter sp.]